MADEKGTAARVRWARFRFGIIVPLLSAPPEKGALAARIAELASKAWRHPSTGEVVRFSAKSIERWYYAAKDEDEPIRVLERKVPKHLGTHPSITPAVEEVIRTLRRDHPRWSYQLVHGNLHALGRERPELGAQPGHATVCRFMKHHGLDKQRKPRRHEMEPGFVPRERRSFEVEHVHGLWHSDFHKAKRRSSRAPVSGSSHVPPPSTLSRRMRPKRPVIAMRSHVLRIVSRFDARAPHLPRPTRNPPHCTPARPCRSPRQEALPPRSRGLNGVA